MEELSGHYKHIILYADNGRLLHHGGPNFCFVMLGITALSKAYLQIAFYFFFLGFVMPSMKQALKSRAA